MSQVILKKAYDLLNAGHNEQVLSLCEQLLKKKRSPYAKDQRTLLIKGKALRNLKRIREAGDTYRLAAELGGTYTAMAWLRAGLLYAAENMSEQAIEALRHTLGYSPANEVARQFLCEHLSKRGRPHEALPHARWILEKGKELSAFVAAGYVFRASTDHEESLACFRKALILSPDDWRVVGIALQAAQFACDWDAVEEYTARFQNELYATDHFSEMQEMHLVHISWCMDEATNLLHAQAMAERTLANIPHAIYNFSNRKKNQRIRVGYVSADLRNHAALHLFCGIFCHHDKEQYEIFTYDHSPNDGSWIRNRYLQAIEHHVDTSSMNNKEVADRIYSDNIDILVDLMGFTDKNRLEVFAMRPAPVQVTWMGFPGTTGTDCMDYIIGDSIVTPDSSKPFFSEKICRLPECYQPNDDERLVADHPFTRKDFGLPEKSIVFVSFNQSYKIDRLTCATWMRILHDVPDSVLWLLEPGKPAREALARAARAHDVSPDRIIYAKSMMPLLHLDRQQLADLALDTHVCGGHTTSADALWAGVPVITAKGKHFASRVASSLLHSVGLDDCITSSMDEMHDMAVNLALHPEKLHEVKERLAKNRFLFPLFDTERLTRHIEHGYRLMFERMQSGLQPDHIDIPVLPSRTVPFRNELPTMHLNDKQLQAALTGITPDIYSLQTSFGVCPLCHSPNRTGVREGKFVLPEGISETFTKYAPQTFLWYQCKDCGHVYRARYWTKEGSMLLANALRPKVFFGKELKKGRRTAGTVVNAILSACQTGFLHLHGAREAPRWLDIYPRSGMWYAMGQEMGIAMTAITDNPDATAAFKGVQGTAVETDFFAANISGEPQIISLHDLLERVPFPDLLLKRAGSLLCSRGLVLFSFKNASSMLWTLEEKNGGSPVWNDAERLHLFTIGSIAKLLLDKNFSLHSTYHPDDSDSELIVLAQKNE